ncbi:murein biosynthesis integral membrane protein MurJ [Nocardioides panaciterrulae]|uniref:Putative peptidoglycan lipid II flippase n=1 Tax=Nocardioides panaciterrulae TaxID=661492 RepID=A0A7Y9E2J0_9ACTN|nr:murein biosynthesis integral membrane protein MurJ [Nocardioides panaciterrulae]NYD40001.1 putative peptidoglycan lipid II flippase [Nocardioides panaciterrulae]
MTASESQKVLGSSAVMAAGTVVSRLSGFARAFLITAALGLGLHADLFTIGNTIPNMLYILLAGGVFNAVLVPQLVRAMKVDQDGGEAYTNRIITLAVVFLGSVTVLLVVAAPWVMQLYLNSCYDSPAMAAERDSVVAFARYCLPQVFFYGMFVLVGQVLNARGRFGPMMWAPIANNVISVAVLTAYLLVYGRASAAEQHGAFTGGQEALLGIGATLGIAVQLLVLLPYLRAAGVTWRPRFDFRGTGLSHTLRLGLWTVLFVVVNQIAYTVVVRLASGGTGCGSSSTGTGYTVYSTTFLIVMVPHSVITVSLATAILPRLAARASEGDLAGLATSLSGTLRTALAVIIPFAALMPVIARDVANTVAFAAAREHYELFVLSLALFGPAIALFTVHYLMLRGFYALEQTRRVFWIQCAVAATNIVVALVLVARTDPAHTSPALVVAYASSYAVGSVVSYSVLRRELGGLRTPTLVRFGVRMAIAVTASTAVAYAVHQLLGFLGEEPTNLVAALRALLVTGADVVVFLVLARLLHVREVTEVVDTVAGRLPGMRTRGSYDGH